MVLDKEWPSLVPAGLRLFSAGALELKPGPKVLKPCGVCAAIVFAIELCVDLELGDAADRRRSAGKEFELPRTATGVCETLGALSFIIWGLANFVETVAMVAAALCRAILWAFGF